LQPLARIERSEMWELSARMSLKPYAELSGRSYSGSPPAALRFRSVKSEVGVMLKSTTSRGIQSINYHVSSVVDGSPVSVRQWLPPPEIQAKAVVQLTHGISEHSGRYDRFARYLAESGYRVYASDLRGHGLSVPQEDLGQASIHFWADTTADMKQLLDTIQTENPSLPHFAFGHSLGSALTQAHIQSWGGMFKGAILCGTFGAFPGMTESQLRDAVETTKPLALSADTSNSVRHEPMNDVSRDQFHADVVSWLDQHLPRH
jgi:alpha-beta hydrolase superfamily lysophospholipase